MMILKNYTNSIFRNHKAYIALWQPNPGGLFCHGTAEQKTVSVDPWQKELQQGCQLFKKLATLNQIPYCYSQQRDE